MSLREEMRKYEHITGESAEHVPIIKLGAFLDGYETAIKALGQQPKTGHWIRQTDNYHDYYECEHCGIAVGLDDIRNYCPNCGTKMEGVEEDDNEDT